MVLSFVTPRGAKKTPVKSLLREYRQRQKFSALSEHLTGSSVGS